MRFEVVLWDFGDTLADERWMLTPPPGLAGWRSNFVEHIWQGELGKRWNCGEINVTNVAALLAEKLGAQPRECLDHMAHCCTKIILFPNAMSAVRRITCPQAIVTINPHDLFTDWVVPNCRLGEFFDVIVTSGEMQSLDKNVLCVEALKRLGAAHDNAEVLLIDNREENVEGWRQQGGSGYHFRGDDIFGHEMQALFGFAAPR